MDIPEIKIAVIGGSAIMGVDFPGALDDVEIHEEDAVYGTPFGPSASFTTAVVGGIEFLYVPFHGITQEIRNVEPDSAGERLFYVLMKAGVTKIIGTALCGSTNRLLDPSDVVIPDGFVDYTTKRPQSLTRSLKRKGVEVESTMYRLHQPFCPSLSRLLVEGSRDARFPRVFSRGTVGVAEGPRLESPSEISRRYTQQGIDVVTMNLVPEVFFAREIGACYAALELVSNYGEGLVSREWSGHSAFGDFLDSWSKPAAEAILHALRNMDVKDDSCGCSRHRWKTIIE